MGGLIFVPTKGYKMKRRVYVVYFRGCPIGSDETRGLAECIIGNHMKSCEGTNTCPHPSDYRIVEETIGE